MEDLIKLLDGSIDDVKAGLPGKSHDDLLKLKAAEQDGKNRKGALEAIDAALAAADAKRAGGTVAGALTHANLASDAGAVAANIPAAETIDTSGAPQQIVPDVDMSHPAVDADPRGGTTEVQNRIDFNDPTLSGREAVEKILADQGKA
ncbi:hypothetical protein [Novosphingobium guangzhouense]|uniref:Uncharacterized protein n=1 Tax=Novosphingobium guangzhouense TaxID=1850347 RepID=A0A2K2FUQ2_9SPHN|nr:hypothetical protein [Novosphingobium guangzhouense]PNU02513.1 hypothetical protein A8V01_09035 [Novosphingobium guangzhouense]